MKTFRSLFSVMVLVSVCVSATGCHTARDVAEDTTDVAAHGVHKTAHAVEHGVHKVEKHL